MKEKKEKTIGEQSLELLKKTNSDPIEVIEVQREIQKGSSSKKSQEEEVWDCVDRGRRDSSIEGDFYVIILTKQERHLKNVIRFYYFYRQSCPTPHHDQTVFKYIREGDELGFLWTIPDKVNCSALIRALQAGEIHPDQERLAHMSLAYIEGDLDTYCKKLNKELP